MAAWFPGASLTLEGYQTAPFNVMRGEQLDLLAILVVLLGFWALGEAFWPGILERPPGGKVLFEWVLLPLLILLFFLLAFYGGDPQTYAKRSPLSGRWH
jgi:hypothetical protein